VPFAPLLAMAGDAASAVAPGVPPPPDGGLSRIGPPVNEKQEATTMDGGGSGDASWMCRARRRFGWLRKAVRTGQVGNLPHSEDNYFRPDAL
jgi:hypothetical protein